MVWNKQQGLATPALHQTMAHWLNDRYETGDLELLLSIFRNAGKSTIVGLFAAWLLYINRDLRILVVSAEHELAAKMTRNVRSIMEKHHYTSSLIRSGQGQWAADRFTIPRERDLRDPSVLARGLNGNITGARADIIIHDDVEVPNTCDTAGKRAALREKLTELSFVLVPGGTRLFVGTPHSYYSIYAREARLEAGESAPFLKGFSRLEIPIQDEEGNSAWPERFSAFDLTALKKRVGPQQFRSQMLLQPTPSGAVRLNPDDLKTYRDEISTRSANGRMLLQLGEKPMRLSACFWDPSYGRPNGGDGSVIAAVFADESNHYYVHDIAYLKFDPAKLQHTDEASQLCAQALEFASRNHQITVTVENNGLGRFLPGLLRKMASKQQQGIKILEKTSTKNKQRRIMEAFDPLLSAGHLFIHERVLSSPLIEEMREWRAVGHVKDDGLDAIAACIHHIPVKGRPSAISIREDWRQTGGTHLADSEFSL